MLFYPFSLQKTYLCTKICNINMLKTQFLCLLAFVAGIITANAQAQDA